MKRLLAMLLALSCAFLVSCSKADEMITTTTEAIQIETSDISKAANMQIRINNISFVAELYDNETENEFRNMLPLTLDMSELHGNEKYCYLNNALPTDSQSVGFVEAGDIMLYGDDCIVIFYESFSTSYSYTKIGHIIDTTGLREAVGNGDVTVELL